MASARPTPKSWPGEASTSSSSPGTRTKCERSPQKLVHSKNSESIHFGYADDFLSAEEEFGIETKIIVADFSKGRTVFDHIAQELKNVDVGILGMQK
jgi:hypothetical protein